MPSYVIIDIEVADPIGYEKYKKLAAPTLSAYDGKYLVRGGSTELLEGEWSPKRLVVLEFPTVQLAKQWWASPEYEEAKAIRRRTARTQMIVAEGVGAHVEPAATPGPEAQVSLREVTIETLYEVCRLSFTLSDAHRRMVATNAFSIAEAHFSPYAWYRAIYADETLVGFIMLHDHPSGLGYFLWRLMVAGPHQGKGYGRRAVELLIEYVKTRPGATELRTSCGQGQGSPEGFYRRLGFERDGRMYEDEVGLSLLLTPQEQAGSPA